MLRTVLGIIHIDEPKAERGEQERRPTAVDLHPITSSGRRQPP
jgi:hypothetical protein